MSGPRTADDAAEAGGGEADVPEITVIGGNPTAVELAAVTAVVTALAQEQRDDDRITSGSAVSAWHRSQRSLRLPLAPGPGAWRGFSA